MEKLVFCISKKILVLIRLQWDDESPNVCLERPIQETRLVAEAIAVTMLSKNV